MINPSTYTVVGEAPDALLYCEENYVYIQDQGTDKEKRYHSGDAEPYQTRYSTTGQLYRACVREHGRCTGKMYQDLKDGKTIQVGWVFLKKAAPERGEPNPTGLQETWVTVYRTPPEKMITWTPPEYPTFKREKANATATHTQ
jgi:hypothetical protein